MKDKNLLFLPRYSIATHDLLLHIHKMMTKIPHELNDAHRGMHTYIHTYIHTSADASYYSSDGITQI